MQPIYQLLNPAPSVVDTFQRFATHTGCLLLDSSMQIQSAAQQPLGRYSFLMADPVDWIELPVGSPNPFRELRQKLAGFQLEPVPELPPMQGGYAGLLSYELNQSLETRLIERTDPFQIPALALGGYDWVIAWDHAQQQAWIISSGFPETEEDSRVERARARLTGVLSILCGPLESQPDSASASRETIPLNFQYPVPGPPELSSNFSPEGFQAAVQRGIDYINEGDLFQVNLAQRLMYPAFADSSSLFLELRKCNPAPFSGYFNATAPNGSTRHPFQIVSASPERLVSVRGRKVETRPIKGTRRRSGIPMVDIQAQEQLLASEKDRAENTMIVDLMRNDLSRCCRDESVVVTQLCELEKYQSVFHLVSAVQSELREDATNVDLIEAVFPGGSVTGAPKHRAMQIIRELEPDARGPYCGSLGYFGFNGDVDFNILIRTITAAGGWWQIPVGGGIVNKSRPGVEYEETWTKAAGLLRAIEALRTNRRHEEFSEFR